MTALIRVRDDLLISTDEITRASPQMVFTKGGMGYSIDDKTWAALCAVALPRPRGLWLRLFGK